MEKEIKDMVKVKREKGRDLDNVEMGNGGNVKKIIMKFMKGKWWKKWKWRWEWKSRGRKRG